MGDHSLYAEGSLVFRDIKDYIQRNVQDLSGGRENATYTNYGKVLTKGYNPWSAPFRSWCRWHSHVLR